jgi:uncharacterized protein YdhG (YjbR/CyaY superfamily)
MSAKKRFTSIDEYIAACPKQTHERLQVIRAEIKRLAPEAREKISYQIAAFELNGRNLIHFAGWKKHISLYPIPAGDEAFEEAASKYADGKGTMKFPLDEPMPYPLIKRIVALRLRQNVAKAAAKRRKR